MIKYLSLLSSLCIASILTIYSAEPARDDLAILTVINNSSIAILAKIASHGYQQLYLNDKSIPKPIVKIWAENDATWYPIEPKQRAELIVTLAKSTVSTTILDSSRPVCGNLGALYDRKENWFRVKYADEKKYGDSTAEYEISINSSEDWKSNKVIATVKLEHNTFKVAIAKTATNTKLIDY